MSRVDTASGISSQAFVAAFLTAHTLAAVAECQDAAHDQPHTADDWACAAAALLSAAWATR